VIIIIIIIYIRTTTTILVLLLLLLSSLGSSITAAATTTTITTKSSLIWQQHCWWYLYQPSSRLQVGKRRLLALVPLQRLPQRRGHCDRLQVVDTPEPSLPVRLTFHSTMMRNGKMISSMGTSGCSDSAAQDEPSVQNCILLTSRMDPTILRFCDIGAK
jgi:hypothetical protein